MTNLYSATAKIVLTGSLTLESSYRTTFPPLMKDDSSYDSKSGLRKTPIIGLKERDLANDALRKGKRLVQYEGGAQLTSLVSANSWKSGIRRPCSLKVNREATKAGIKVTLANEYERQTGQSPLNEEKEFLPEALAQWEKEHPLTKHFGKFKIASTMEFGDGMPVDKPAEEGWAANPKLKMSADYINRYMSQEARDEFLDKRDDTAGKSELKAEIKRLNQEIAKEKKVSEASETLDELKEQLAEKKAELKGEEGAVQENADQMIFSVNYTPKGTVFKQVHRLHDVRDSVPASLLIYGLKAYALNPQLGALKGYGWGRFTAKWTVTLNEFDEQPVTLGELIIDGVNPLKFEAASELGQKWFDDAVADTSWYTKI